VRVAAPVRRLGRNHRRSDVGVREDGGPYPAGSTGDYVCTLAALSGISPQELANCTHEDLVTLTAKLKEPHGSNSG
jgi:hypothetical protein